MMDHSSIPPPPSETLETARQSESQVGSISASAGPQWAPQIAGCPPQGLHDSDAIARGVGGALGPAICYIGPTSQAAKSLHAGTVGTLQVTWNSKVEWHEIFWSGDFNWTTPTRPWLIEVQQFKFFQIFTEIFEYLCWSPPWNPGQRFTSPHEWWARVSGKLIRAF